MTYIAAEDESLNQIADWLNDQHIPTSQDVLRRRQNVLRREQGNPEKPEQGTKWRSTTVRKVLGSPTLIGDMTKNDQPLRDADGMPIQRCDPIISAEDFALVAKKLEAKPPRRLWEPRRRGRKRFSGWKFRCSRPRVRSATRAAGYTTTDCFHGHAGSDTTRAFTCSFSPSLVSTSRDFSELGASSPLNADATRYSA